MLCHDLLGGSVVSVAVIPGLMLPYCAEKWLQWVPHGEMSTMILELGKRNLKSDQYQQIPWADYWYYSIGIWVRKIESERKKKKTLNQCITKATNMARASTRARRATQGPFRMLLHSWACHMPYLFTTVVVETLWVFSSWYRHLVDRARSPPPVCKNACWVRSPGTRVSAGWTRHCDLC